jgi:2-polyprenyl-3-methyl-5-hydroxy-6-metoxy-1,4-benzoquinol methylase
MNEESVNSTLIEFWNQVFARDEENQNEEYPDDFRELAPSEELYHAAASLAERRKVLDYGCGSGWASLIMAHHGCTDITAADPAENAVKTVQHAASRYRMSEQIHPVQITPQWPESVPDRMYDGIFCSNVLDVVPEKTAEEILRQFSRTASDDADVIIGMNYYLSPQAASARNIELADGRYLYANGILRLVSRTDEEWEEFFSPYFTVKCLKYFAWPQETEKTRRLFYLEKKQETEIPA